MSHFLHKFIQKVVNSIKLRVASTFGKSNAAASIIVPQEDYELREAND
jgi:hypothetical protein